MKTIFDQITRDELIARINAVNETSKAQWGKMNSYQMVRHCILWEYMMFGRKRFKRTLIGYLFGKMALRSILRDETPLRRSTPTIPDLLVQETHGEMATEKAEWISLIEEYAHFSNVDFIHPFFGKMTKAQIGYFVSLAMTKLLYKG